MVLTLKMSPKLQTINRKGIMNQSTQQHFEMRVKEWRKYNKFSYNWNKQEKFKETTISKYNHKAKLQLPTSPPQLCHNNQHKHKNIGTKKCVLQIWYRQIRRKRVRLQTKIFKKFNCEETFLFFSNNFEVRKMHLIDIVKKT